MNSKGATPLRVAVLIPAWNEKAYIVEALDSVASQTRFPDELIVVDDGSSDCTSTIVREWSAKHGITVELMKQERSGVASARNRGLKHTHADLVAILDADDLFMPDHLESAVAAFQHHPELVLCFADVDVLSGKHVVRPSFLADKRVQMLDSEAGANGLQIIAVSPFTSLIRGNYIPVSTSVYRVAALHEIGLYDESLINAADRDLNLRLSRHGPFGFYPTRSSHMRKRENSLSVFDRLRAQHYRFRVVEKMYEDRDELALSDVEMLDTRKALSEEARLLLAVAAYSGPRAYCDVVRLIRAKRLMRATYYPKDMLRIIARTFGVASK